MLFRSSLCIGNVDTMNSIFIRDADVEAFVSAVMRVAAYIPDPAPGSSEASQHVSVIERG